LADQEGDGLMAAGSSFIVIRDSGFGSIVHSRVGFNL
jgi:hypothetical protein